MGDHHDKHLTHISQEILKKAICTNTPSPIRSDVNKLSNAEKINRIAKNFHDIMETLGLDLSDPSLERTPYRVAKMYVEEIFSGLDPSTFPKISLIEDFSNEQNKTMIFVKVTFSSFCEHHFVPMIGSAWVAYLPNKKLLGLSKIPRLVRFFARRPQIQERLNAQIADALSLITGSEHVAVSLSAEHHCMTARGIESTDSHTITNVLRGDFSNNAERRREFFDAVNR